MQALHPPSLPMARALRSGGRGRSVRVRAGSFRKDRGIPPGSLVSWAEQNGADLAGVEVNASETHGWGLFAARDAEEGTELARVPLSLCVTEVPGRNLLQPDAPRDLPWSAFMAASLMHRSSEDKYLLSLPQSSPCLTDSHSHDELKELQFLDAYYAAFEYDWLCFDTYDAISQTEWASSMGGVDESEWRRAMGLVHSRTFRVHLDAHATAQLQHEEHAESDTLRLMVPVLDQANQSDSSHPQTVDWEIESEKGYMILRTTSSVAAGDELLTSYGGKSNEITLLYYGFLQEDNPAESVPLFESIEHARKWAESAEVKTSQTIEDKAEEECPLPLKRGDGCSLSKECEVDEPLVRAIMESTGKEDMVSCGRLLQARCGELIKALPTSLADDCELLQSGHADSIVHFRKLRKEILHEFLALQL